ncbi:ROK family protein [Luteipulveratus mongoliensis]|uniref:ROK family transcriptional regulator n=1 Tax=Luteipulveratus mongoliensis TaxID=571913 RepID=A0A0K1JE43_9MICO|nr:ROK family protein [Luteipulveratus mongoliensis]AKU14976.1 hypothetical protein VV02_02355 [Luteipulveratus mongoliensis]
MKAPTVTAVAAFDVGGTRVKAALVDVGLQVIASVTVPTPEGIADDPATALKPVLEELIDRAEEGVKVVHVGVVVPGLIDDESGVALLAVNLGWRDLPLRQQITDGLGLPAAIGHDVRAGLLAERRLGAAVGAQDVLFVPIGTGIAAALMIDGHLLNAQGWTGEIGHAIVDPSGALCSCGARGCLETIASASAIARRYSAVTGRKVTASDVAALVDAGTDDAARQVWAEAVDALATVLSTTIIATGADRIVIGGGLVLSGDTLLEPLRRAVGARMTLGRRPEIVASQLQDRAGCLGAAVLAWNSYS